MQNIIIPYYSGNIHFSKVIGYISLEKFIDVIKNPKPKTTYIINQIKIAEANNDIELKRTLKQQLYSFTPAVVIPINKQRNYNNIVEFTGLMQIDLDHIETEQEAVSIKYHLFENYKQIVCAFLSPSRKGVKALLKIEKPKDIEHYKALHKGMVNTFEEYSYLDLITKNAVLPMFLSIDNNILYRSYDEATTWTYCDYTETKYTHLNISNVKKETTPQTSDKQRVINIIKNRIDRILDNGHPQVRSTSLILGSRVAAGYISMYEARELIKDLIYTNNYLQKNINGYIKTANWAINEGTKCPLYF